MEVLAIFGGASVKALLIIAICGSGLVPASSGCREFTAVSSGLLVLLVKFTEGEDGAVALTVKLPLKLSFAILRKEELLAADMPISATTTEELWTTYAVSAPLTIFGKL